MLAAETTVFLHLKTIGSVLLVLCGVVVSLLTFVASKCNFNSHYGTSNSFASLPKICRLGNFSAQK